MSQGTEKLNNWKMKSKLRLRKDFKRDSPILTEGEALKEWSVKDGFQVTLPIKEAMMIGIMMELQNLIDGKIIKLGKMTMEESTTNTQK